MRNGSNGLHHVLGHVKQMVIVVVDVRETEIERGKDTTSEASNCDD